MLTRAFNPYQTVGYLGFFPSQMMLLEIYIHYLPVCPPSNLH